MPCGSVQYILWRQDDHGNTLWVCRFHSREQADRVCQRHRQRYPEHRYWVTPLQPQTPN